MNNLIDLFQAGFQTVNLPATLLLLLVLIYWLTVIFGVMDLSSLDVDLPETEVEAGADGGVFQAFLEYFNIRYVPVSIMISLYALSFWVISMVANEYVNPIKSGLIGLVIFLVNIPVSAHVAKWAGAPLVPLFRGMRKEVSGKRKMIGCRVVVTSSKADADFGQAEISGDGPPITLSVRTEGEVIPKGVEAVILSYQEEANVYTITSMEI